MQKSVRRLECRFEITIGSQRLPRTDSLQKVVLRCSKGITKTREKGRISIHAWWNVLVLFHLPSRRSEEKFGMPGERKKVLLQFQWKLIVTRELLDIACWPLKLSFEHMPHGLTNFPGEIVRSVSAFVWKEVMIVTTSESITRMACWAIIFAASDLKGVEFSLGLKRLTFSHSGHPLFFIERRQTHEAITRRHVDIRREGRRWMLHAFAKILFALREWVL